MNIKIVFAFLVSIDLGVAFLTLPPGIETLMALYGVSCAGSAGRIPVPKSLDGSGVIVKKRQRKAVHNIRPIHPEEGGVVTALSKGAI